MAQKLIDSLSEEQRFIILQELLDGPNTQEYELLSGFVQGFVQPAQKLVNEMAQSARDANEANEATIARKVAEARNARDNAVKNNPLFGHLKR